MDSVIKFFSSPENLAAIFLGLYFLSEILSLIPSVKANGTFQLVYNFLKSKAPKKPE